MRAYYSGEGQGGTKNYLVSFLYHIPVSSDTQTLISISMATRYTPINYYVTVTLSSSTYIVGEYTSHRYTIIVVHSYAGSRSNGDIYR